jgi:hypothetical protein
MENMKRKCWSKALVQLLLVFVFAGIHGSSAQAQECAPNAFCGGKIAPATSGYSPANGPNGEPVRAGVGWESTAVFTGGFTVGLMLADARGDGTVRLYATQITDDTVREFAYEGTWTNTSTVRLPFYAEAALLSGDGRGKGGTHLYVGEFAFGGNGAVSEFTWNGATWTGAGMGATHQQLISAASGDPRGDGLMHLYFGTGSAPPNNVAYEFNFVDPAWTFAPIHSSFSGQSTGAFGIAVGDGRNDTVQRVYEGVLDAVGGRIYAYEFSWNGAGWDALQVADLGVGQVTGVAVGDGRNDGINRVYVLSRNSGVLEFTYDGETFAQTADIPVGSEVLEIAIGDGQNDLTNRLYIAQLTPSRVVEASFDGATWQTNVVGTLSGNSFRVRVGDARGDSMNRVYVSNSLGVYEFTHQ